MKLKFLIVLVKEYGFKEETVLEQMEEHTDLSNLSAVKYLTSKIK